MYLIIHLEFIEKVRAYANEEDIQTLSSLRESIISRIEALDIFYESNYLDGTVPIFHMIKLKLKAAIFRTENTYNDIISMQLSNKFNSKEHLSYQRQSSSRNRFDDLRASNKTGKFEITQKSKSRSKSKKKKHSTEFKATDSWVREEETNLMDEFEEHGNNFIEPLFKPNLKDKEQSTTGSKQILNKSKEKIMSPFNKKPIKTSEIESKKIKSSSYINSTSSTKVLQQPKSIYSNQQKSKANIAGKSKVNPASKEEQKIVEMESNELKDDPSEFRFTIKMTKEEYKSLLQMKQMIKNGKVI